jgi:hypothetical protein
MEWSFRAEGVRQQEYENVTGNFAGFIGIGVLAAVLATVEHGVLLLLSRTESSASVRVTAPEFTGEGTWLHTDGPMTLRDLRGQVVVLDFRSHEDSQGIRIHPDLKHIEEKYRAEPLVIVAVYAPAGGADYFPEGVDAALQNHEVTHPVFLDAQNRVRKAYGVRAGTTRVIIDPKGGIVGVVAGEGNRLLLDRTVARLLEEHRDRGTLVERGNRELVCSATTIR